MSRGDTRASGRTRANWLGLRPETLLALVGIVALLVPLSLLSQPADSEGPGGVLARMRKARGLSQANLGEIDPAGETMRFATLGLKNVATTLLESTSRNSRALSPTRMRSLRKPTTEGSVSLWPDGFLKTSTCP